MSDFIHYIGFLPLIYIILVNLAGFLICFTDKQRAIKHQWRISEKTIFITAVIGGSLGVLIGMYTFHHKTRHWYFVVGIPLILIGQIALYIYFTFIR